MVTAILLALLHVCKFIRCSGCLRKQAGNIINTILNMWGTPEIDHIKPSFYHLIHSANLNN